MADTKITALTAISTVDPAVDVLPIVDVSDTSMAASGTTKKSTINQLLGSGGTATLASATITGDLTVDTNVLKVDTSNNRVGIGTATPADTLDVNGRVTALRYLSSSSSASLPSYAVAAGNGIYNSGANQIGFAINSANAMTLNASGNLAFPTGKGIDFSATTEGSGTMTSELLNDYEEGTWTGTLKGSTTDPTIPVTATGKYTKIGRQVSVQISFETVSTVGALGDLSISGLPFANSSGIRTMGTAGAFLGATFSGTLITAISASGSSIDYQSVDSNAAWSSATHNAGTGRFFWANVTYTV
jgi:hypothetical protein